MASIQTKNGITLEIGAFRVYIVDENGWVVYLYYQGKYWGELDVSLSGARNIISNIQFQQMMRVA